jgi:lysine 2,3-aminomutase
MPRVEESRVLSYETTDPLADDQYLVRPRLIHHYRDRALVLVHDQCAMYCRHCFRRHFTAREDGAITRDELTAVADYLRAHPEVQEILLSGGDPLMLSDSRLAELVGVLREVNADYILRLATRMPVVQPARITERLIDGLLRGSAAEANSGAVAGLWVVTQVNHPRELTPAFEHAVSRFLRRGIPVANQTVLLRGVNNSTEILETLFRGLLRVGVKPYYLFQGDLAAGTRHFRTSIEAGLEIIAGLRRRLSGLALPTYAVDLPDGAGKLALHPDSILRVEEGWYVLRGADGREYRYPREPEAEID